MDHLNIAQDGKYTLGNLELTNRCHSEYRMAGDKDIIGIHNSTQVRGFVYYVTLTMTWADKA